MDLLWPAASLRPGLGPGEVHVFAVEVDAPAAAGLLDELAPDERERAARFHFERDRRRFAATRASLRRLLGGYLGQPAAAVRFAYGPRGKPSLAGEPASLRFNVTHSGGLALLAFTTGFELGVDVEPLRPVEDAEAIAERYFSPAEAAVLRGLAEPERSRAFLRGWTLKEAFIKATGDGLSRPLDEFEVPLLPDEPARLLRLAGDPAAAARWWLQDLAPAEGFAAALAVEERPARVLCWRL